MTLRFPQNFSKYSSNFFQNFNEYYSKLIPFSNFHWIFSTVPQSLIDILSIFLSKIYSRVWWVLTLHELPSPTNSISLLFCIQNKTFNSKFLPEFNGVFIIYSYNCDFIKKLKNTYLMEGACWYYWINF